MTDATSQEDITHVTQAAEQLAAALKGPDVVLAEPDEDELGDDLVFVRNGWLRVMVAGEVYKLRRPFLGELRDLELSRETDNETLVAANKEMREKTSELLKRAHEIEIEARGLNGGNPERKSELDHEATQFAFEATRLSRQVIRQAQDLRAGWWEQVFQTLAPPGRKRVPKQLPSWVGDGQLQQRVIEHWQSSPLARGGV